MTDNSNYQNLTPNEKTEIQLAWTIFLVFVFLFTLVLINLLNAIAFYDVQVRTGIEQHCPPSVILPESMTFDGISFQKLREDAIIVTNKARIINMLDCQPLYRCLCMFSNLNAPGKSFFEKLQRFLRGSVSSTSSTTNLTLSDR